MKIDKASDRLRHLQPSIENVFPKKVKVYTTDGSYVLVKSDLTREHGIIRCFYYHNTPDELGGKVTADGEPDTLGFDIHVIDEDSKRKIKVDITYGDSMKYEFSITEPNIIKIFHYNGIGSKLDSKTHFGLHEKSIKDFIKVFTYLNPNLKLNVLDFHFIDKFFDTHVHNESIKMTPLSTDQKILVVNNGRPTGDPFLSNILDYLRERGIDYVVASNVPELKNLLKSEKIVGSILSGSDFRIMRDGDKLSQAALKFLKCPLIGICFGCQSICKNAGSKIKEGKKLIHGHYKFTKGKLHHLFRGLDLNHTKFSFSFRDYVTECPQGFEVIAKVGDVIVGIADERSRRWGLMFHPEDLENTEIILDNFIKVCHSGQAESDKIKKGQF